MSDSHPFLNSNSLKIEDFRHSDSCFCQPSINQRQILNFDNKSEFYEINKIGTTIFTEHEYIVNEILKRELTKEEKDQFSSSLCDIFHNYTADILKYYKDTNNLPINFGSYYPTNNFAISNFQYYPNNQFPLANLCSSCSPVNMSCFPPQMNPQTFSNQYYLQNSPYQLLPPNFNCNMYPPQENKHTKKSKKDKKDHIKSKSKSKHDKKKSKEHSKKSSKGKKSDDTSISIEFTGKEFCGIIWSLTQKHKGNVNDKGIIDITGNRSMHKDGSFYGSFSSLVDYNFSGKNCFFTDNVPQPVIQFDFKDHRVCVSSYSIKSSNLHGPSCLKTWVLEGSNDQSSWISIDSHNNESCLCDTKPERPKVCNFKVQNKLAEPVRYIRLKETGKSSHGQWPYGITNIEFFGQYN